MPTNGMNVGVDYSIGLYDANTKKVLDLGDVQSFSMKAGKHDVSSRPYNGPPRFGHVPDGYAGSITITRTGSSLEDLQILLNSQFNAGNVMSPGFINETVNNPDGSVSRYQYVNVDFFLTDVGDVSRENVVKQTVEWKAADKVKLS